MYQYICSDFAQSELSIIPTEKGGSTQNFTCLFAQWIQKKGVSETDGLNEMQHSLRAIQAVMAPEILALVPDQRILAMGFVTREQYSAAERERKRLSLQIKKAERRRHIRYKAQQFFLPDVIKDYPEWNDAVIESVVFNNDMAFMKIHHCWLKGECQKTCVICFEHCSFAESESGLNNKRIVENEIIKKGRYVEWHFLTEGSTDYSCDTIRFKHIKVVKIADAV